MGDYQPGGPYCKKKTVPAVLVTAEGRKSRTVLKTENTNRPRLVNDMSCYFFLKCKEILAKKYTQTVSLYTNIPYSKTASILVFFCLLANEPLLPRSRLNIIIHSKYFPFSDWLKPHA